jgi:hypothetical protein
MDTQTHDTYLIKGNIIVFCGKLDNELKEDILNSSLLAELVSTSGVANSRDQLISHYAATVNNLGWIQNSKEFRHLNFGTKGLFEIVESCTDSVLIKEEKQALADAFLQLKKLPPKSPVIQSILDKLQVNVFAPDIETDCFPSTKKPVATSTRLTIVRNNASIITLQIAFKTTDGISVDILDQPVLSAIQDGKSNLWLLVSSLDVRDYGKFRAAVLKKLGNRINTALLHVPLDQVI